MIKASLLLLLTCGYFITGTSQSASTDSLLRNIYAMREDTAKVNRLNELAIKVQFAEPIIAISISDEAIIIAKRLNYEYGLSLAYAMKANLLFYQMKLDSAKILIDKAYALVIDKKDVRSRTQTGLLINRYAGIYQINQKYDSAVARYLEAVAIFTELKDEPKLIYSFYNLSGIYNFLEDGEKAIFYARETRRVGVNSKDPEFAIRTLIALGDAFVSIKEYDSVLQTGEIGLKMASEQNMPFAHAKFHLLLGIYYTEKGKLYDSAINHFTVALESFRAIQTKYDEAIVLQQMGNAYLRKSDYGNAVIYTRQAVTLSKELSLDQVLKLSLLDLVEAEEKLGNINESHTYLKEYVSVNDTLSARNNRKIASDLEAKYQSQKKELLLLSQEKTIRQKNLLNYLLAASIVSIILIFFLSYRTYHQKQKLQQQKISELETEKKLAATEAVLKGEEKERTRLARDLHDGLGGMLSGIKHSFQNMKGNLVMNPENHQSFERGLDMLDTSIKEMRRVAHNLMPEALVKFGLNTALKDFCNDINQSGVLKINYQSIGLENAVIEQTTAITIYRIVQELINNSIKHAYAKTAIVQVSKLNEKLSVTVEDDGKGFDIALLKQSRGIGWDSIQNRVEFLKGKIDVQSGLGKGTSVFLEFNPD